MKPPGARVRNRGRLLHARNEEQSTMARNTIPHTSNYSFPVALEPLFTQDGKESGLYGTVRRDSNVRVFASASERYGLLLNDTLVEQIEEGISKADLSGFERSAFVYDHGARFECQWVFKNRTVKVPKVGDQIAFRITARNSYDGTWKASLLDSVVRLACTNGAVRSENGLLLAKKHTARLDVQTIVSGLQTMLTRFERWAEDLNLLVLPITQAQGSHILSHAEDEGVISGATRDGILSFWNAPRRREDEDRTALNLWNAGTEFMTHVMGRERHQYAQATNARWTGFMLDLGRDQNRLAQVSTPLVLN